MGTLRKTKLWMKVHRDTRHMLLKSRRDEILIDMDGDKEADLALLDISGDGNIDTIAADISGDGELDLLIMDSDGNGIPDALLMDDGEGIITYNSRAYYEDRRRYLATSRDGGESYGQFRCDEFLQDTASMGCNASLLRVERSDLTNTDLLPPEADSVTVFVNPRSENRDHLTACVSFDSGKTWPNTRLIHAGRSAYSSLVFDRKSQQFHLLYETGVNDPYDLGIRAAEFDLEWLLKP